MKNFGVHILSWVIIVICFVGSVLYPFWLLEGYLDDWYLKIMVFIACYGGLITSVAWYKDYLYNNR